MVVSQIMGSVEYMKLVCHWAIKLVMQASLMLETQKSQKVRHTWEVEPAASSSMMTPAAPQTAEEMVELLKAEHEICLESGIFWDANAIRNLNLEFFQVVRDGITKILLSRCKARLFEVFTELGSTAKRGNRTNPA